MDKKVRHSNDEPFFNSNPSASTPTDGQVQSVSRRGKHATPLPLIHRTNAVALPTYPHCRRYLQYVRRHYFASFLCSSYATRCNATPRPLTLLFLHSGTVDSADVVGAFNTSDGTILPRFICSLRLALRVCADQRHR